MLNTLPRRARRPTTSFPHPHDVDVGLTRHGDPCFAACRATTIRTRPRSPDGHRSHRRRPAHRRRTTGSTAPTPATAPTRAPRQKPIPELVTELRDLVVAYVKQETIGPLQSLGRWIGFGIGGSLLLGFGVVFLAMSALRALQEETGETFTGDWSWVPYLIVVFALVVGAAIVWLLRAARKAEKGTT